MDGIYARPETVQIEGGRDFGFGGSPTYRVRWIDPDGHMRVTRTDLFWGEAHVLADMLEHGEPYVRERWTTWRH